MLVKHLVVLEIVQQRRRHIAGVAGQKHRGTFDDMRRAFLEALDQIEQRHFGAPGLVDQDGGATAPRPDQACHQDSEQHRDPGALQQLQKVGGEERQIDHDQRQDQRSSRCGAPIPEFPDHDEAHDAVADHRGRHRDAVGRCQSA